MAVKTNDTVKVHYTGTLDDGSVFDTSAEREPLEFTVGANQVIKGFEDGVVGMEIGEKKKIHIPCAEAYGEKNDQLIFDFPKNQFPEEMELKIGMEVQMMTQDQQPVFVTISEIEGENVKLDANHPMAGKDLNFELELVEIL